MVRLTPATIMVVLAVAVTACGGDAPTTTDDPARTVAFDDNAGTTAEVLPECSATTADIPPLPDQPNLPAAVDDLRTELYDAALACDFDELASLAAEAGEGFTYTLALPDQNGPAALWRSIDGRDRVMEQLARVLVAPHARSGPGEDASFVWPSVSREQPTDADWNGLVDAGIATAEDLETLRSLGSYFGYRTAILPDGRWQLFIAGD